MLDEIIQSIPNVAGSYAFWLHLHQPQSLTIGKLGEFTFPAGEYVYLGSARGPGGLRARLGRHLRGEGKIRWHIDYLRAAAQVRGFGFKIHHSARIDRPPAECAWSQKLAAIPGAQIAVPRFGAGDCTSGCAAHLVYLPNFDPGQLIHWTNCEFHHFNGR